MYIDQLEPKSCRRGDVVPLSIAGVAGQCCGEGLRIGEQWLVVVSSCIYVSSSDVASWPKLGIMVNVDKEIITK